MYSFSFFENLLPEAAHKDDPALVQRFLGVRAGGGGILGGRQLGQAAHGILQPLHAGGQMGGRAMPTYPRAPRRHERWITEGLEARLNLKVKQEVLFMEEKSQ